MFISGHLGRHTLDCHIVFWIGCRVLRAHSHHPVVDENSCCSFSSTRDVSVSNFSCSRGCVLVSLCGYNLCFFDGWWPWGLFLCSLIDCIFFRELLVQVICSIFNLVINLVIDLQKFVLRIPDKVLHRYNLYYIFIILYNIDIIEYV